MKEPGSIAKGRVRGTRVMRPLSSSLKKGIHSKGKTKWFIAGDFRLVTAEKHAHSVEKGSAVIVNRGSRSKPPEVSAGYKIIGIDYLDSSTIKRELFKVTLRRNRSSEPFHGNTLIVGPEDMTISPEESDRLEKSVDKIFEHFPPSM